MPLPVAPCVRSLLLGCLTTWLTVPLYAGAPVTLPKPSGVHTPHPTIATVPEFVVPAGYPVGVIHHRLPQLCFAPGTPVETVEAVHAMMGTSWGEGDAYQFQDRNRWIATAHQPLGRLAQGDPTTLTWSIVPDGTNIIPLYSIGGESSDTSELILYLDGIYGGFGQTDLQLKPWFHLFEESFARWGKLTGITYIYEENDDGRRIRLDSQPGWIGVRGDIRIGGHAIDGNDGILAYNYPPDNGDMVIDTSDNFFHDTSDESHRLRNIVMHEHGHGLGFEHVCPEDQTKLMEPTYTGQFLGPQFDDILAGHRGYGDPDEPNDKSSLATELGDLENGEYDFPGASIDDDGDTDWYRLGLEADRSLSVTLSPVGSTYLSGPQNRDGSCTAGDPFNALTQQNLGVEVVGTDGVTVLAQANAHGVGVAESIVNLSLGGDAGFYYIRVFGTIEDKVQLYTLEIAVADDVPGLPKLLGASSRKFHGQSGKGVEFDLPLALQGNATIEPREGGVDRIILKFNSAVTMSCADVSLTSATCDTVTDLGDGLTWELRLTGTPENSCETLTLLASLGLDETSPSSVRMVNILGDVNQSNSVTIWDLSRVKAGIARTSGGAVDDRNFLLDIQLTNSITIGDLSAVKSNFFQGAACVP